MSVLRGHRGLVAFVLLGLAAAAAVLIARHRLEARYRTMTIALDAEGWELLAKREGQALAPFWRALRERGANAVAVYDLTLRRLADANRVRVFDGAALRDLLTTSAAPPALRGVAAAAIDPHAVYVLYEREDVGRLLRRGLATALGSGRVRDVPGGRGALAVSGRLRDLEEASLGFLPADVRAWEARGFDVALRPRNLRGADPARLRARVASYAELGSGRTFIPELTDVLGFERLLKEAAEALRGVDGRYGRVEILAQQRRIRGEDALTRYLRPAVVRVFSLTPEELDRFEPPDAVDRFVRAARERNVRILYVRPFLNTTAGIDPVAVNLAYVDMIATRIGEAGFAIGRATPLPPLPMRWTLHAVLLLGAVSSIFLLLALVADLAGWRAPSPLWPAATLAVTALALAVTAAGFDGWVRKGLALAVAVVFPTLALYLGVPPPGRAQAPGRAPIAAAMRFAIGRLWLISAGSLLGGLLIGALLAEWRFMLAFDQFPGVKMATVLPVLAFAAMWILRWERGLPAHERQGLIARVWASLERPLSWRHAVLALTVAGVVLLMLVRSGNTSLPLVGVEERLRSFVEDALVARPRTKEYLFGHPLLLMALAAAALRLPGAAFPLAAAGSVGQTGLLNSFCHIHTPVLYSLWRTGNALVIGTVVGIAAAAIAAFAWQRWGASVRAAVMRASAGGLTR